MATLAVITLPLSGHIHPMMVACRALKADGHRPIVVGPVDLIEKLPPDIDSFPMGESDLPAGQLNALCGCLSRMTRLSDMRQMFQVVARLSQLYIDHLPDALEAIGADAILHDQLEPGAGIVARGLARSHNLRHISLACALPMNRDASVPPPLMGWKYNDSAFGHWMNAGYYRVVDWLLKEQSEVLQSGAARFGLTKPDHAKPFNESWSVHDGLSESCDLAQGLASLDYPRENPPAYLGPLRDDRLLYPGYETIAHERDGRPLCFISLGTLMGGRASVLRSMAKAADQRGMQPVVVHGGRLRAENSIFPRGTILRDFLDQRAVMDEASAAIIHGGYNSTTDAVAAGLPLVTVPLAFEQSAIGARVERAGLGRVVGLFGPSLSQRIRFALGDVLRSQTMRQSVRRAQYEAKAAPAAFGLVKAVNDELDRPLGATPQHAPRRPRVEQTSLTDIPVK